MDRQAAQRLTTQWSRQLTPRSWPWEDVVEESGRATDGLREAMFLQLIDLVPDLTAATVQWPDRVPVVIGFAGDSIFLIGCRLEAAQGRPWGTARGWFRRIPVAAETTKIEVETTGALGSDRYSRNARWQFEVGGEAIAVIGNVWDDGEIDDGEEVARAICSSIGYEVAPVEPFVISSS